MRKLNTPDPTSFSQWLNRGTHVAGPLANLKILPVRLRVTYATYYGPQTRALYVVLGSD